MDQIWHRPAWLWPVLHVGACFDILFPEQGSDIGASMIVDGQYDGHGYGTQIWNRTPRHFHATMRFDLRLVRVVEYMAPLGLLEVAWDVHWEKPSTIHINTTGIRVVIGRFCVQLPRWAGVEMRVKETALMDRSETIIVDLRVHQPWSGEIFGQSAQFSVRLEQKEESRYHDHARVRCSLAQRPGLAVAALSPLLWDLCLVRFPRAPLCVLRPPAHRQHGHVIRAVSPSDKRFAGPEMPGRRYVGRALQRPLPLLAAAISCPLRLFWQTAPGSSRA